MSRQIRRGIVTLLALAAGMILIAPAAQAQTDEAKKQLLSALKRAEALEEQGKLAEATQVYERAVDLARRALGPEHSITADFTNNLAILYVATGRYADAEPLYRRGLE